MNQITFAGRIEKRDYLRVQRALLHPGWRWAPAIALGLLVIASLPGAAYRVFLDRPLYYLSRIPVGLFLLAASVIVPMLAVRTAWKRDRATKGAVSGVISEEGIEWHGAAIDIRVPWEHVSAFRIVRGVPVVFSDEHGTFLFPSQLFVSDEANRAFRQAVEARVRAV